MKVTLDQKANIHNRFLFEVIDAKTGAVKQKAIAENIILDALWSRMFTPATWFNYIFFGTGSGTLSASRTGLFTHLGYKTPGTPTFDTSHHDDGHFSCMRSCQLTETEYVGSTLTEVGIAYGTTSSNLVTHAVLKDMNGNPISIEKTSLDVINIYATVFLVFPAAGWLDGGIAISKQVETVAPTKGCGLLVWLFGLALMYTSSSRYQFFFSQNRRPLNFSAYADDDFVGAQTFTYNLATKKMSLNHRVAVGNGNFAQGIGSVEFQPMTSFASAYQNMRCFSVDLMNTSVFSGSVIDGEAVATGDGSTVDFQTDFPIDAGATVYVDGVAQTSGVTVDTGKPSSNNIWPYMRGLYNEWPVAYDSDDSCLNWAQNSNVGSGAKNKRVFENTLYATYGINTIYTGSYMSIECSNDLVNWVTAVAAASGAYPTARTIPSEYVNYRYWRVSGTASTSAGNLRLDDNIVCNALTGATHNIHFDTAPANGAVITADYTTHRVAKDVNHVFDFTLELTFAEYTP